MLPVPAKFATLVEVSVSVPASPIFTPNIFVIVVPVSIDKLPVLENVNVFDLSSKSNVSNWILGSSYSELLVKHFGLENEFGPKADKFLEELNKAYSENNLSKLKELLIINQILIEF